jgi:hypothetical protein
MGGKRSWDKRKLGKQNTKKHQTVALLEFKLRLRNDSETKDDSATKTG